MDWQQVLSEFVMAFALALAPVAATAATAWVVAVARQAWAAYRSSHAAEAYWLEMVARQAVLAAEQAQVAGFVAEKREYAFRLIERQLQQHGYTVDIDLIYAAIEAAVLEEFNRGREPAEPEPAG